MSHRRAATIDGAAKVAGCLVHVPGMLIAQPVQGLRSFRQPVELPLQRLRDRVERLHSFPRMRRLLHLEATQVVFQAFAQLLHHASAVCSRLMFDTVIRGMARCRSPSPRMSVL